MKRSLLAALVLVLATMVHAPARAAVDINIGIALPPPLVLPAPPNLIVLPDTDDVWVDPDVGVELFFWDGWWWHSWEGRWYRSHYYDRDWSYFSAVPAFFWGVDPEWRVFCREHRWHGHRWDFQRLPAQEVRDHWRNWHKNSYWQKHKGWNVENYRPPSGQQRSLMRRQRQTNYRRRPEVQRHAQERQQFRQQQRQRPAGQRPTEQRPTGREQQRGAQQRPQRVQSQPGAQHERRAPQVRERQPGAQIPHGPPAGPQQRMEAPRPEGRPGGQPGGHGQPGAAGHPGREGRPAGQPREEHGR